MYLSYIYVCKKKYIYVYICKPKWSNMPPRARYLFDVQSQRKQAGIGLRLGCVAAVYVQAVYFNNGDKQRSIDEPTNQRDKTITPIIHVERSAA